MKYFVSCFKDCFFGSSPPEPQQINDLEQIEAYLKYARVYSTHRMINNEIILNIQLPSKMFKITFNNHGEITGLYDGDQKIDTNDLEGDDKIDRNNLNLSYAERIINKKCIPYLDSIDDLISHSF